MEDVLSSVLIIPDVHGRTVWKKAVEKAVFDKVVFLGDYLDPYRHDLDITRESALENFKDILAYKKVNPERTVLLLGNHDCTYIYSRTLCSCRSDDENYDEIRALFRDNRDLFQLAWEVSMGDKRYLFTHAGLSIGWLNRYVDDWTLDNVTESLNRLNSQALLAEQPELTPFARALSVRGRYRGAEDDYASPVWMDAELLNESAQLSDVVQIVGHTQRVAASPVFTPNVIYADCGGPAFILDRSGTVRDLSGAACRNEFEDPFNPPKGLYDNHNIGFDCFHRPFCRLCGSRDIYVHGGMMADTFACNVCGVREYL